MSPLHLFKKSSLRTRILAVLVPLLMASFLVLGILAVKFTRDQINSGLKTSADQQTSQIAHTLTEPAILGDLLSAEQHMRIRISQPGLLWLHFDDGTHPPIQVSRPGYEKKRPDWFARWLALTPPLASQIITVGGRSYGTVTLQLDTTGDENQVWLILWRSLAAYALVLLLTAWVIARLLHLNLKGLVTLREMVREFEQGRFDARVVISPFSPPEILETATAFNHTADRVVSLIEEMRLMAFHDQLTGLPNRRALEGRLERALRMAHEDASQHVFCYIDLDQFKLINDTCGHAAGDMLLNQLPQAIKHALPADAYFGRLGGDEFGLLLFNQTTQNALVIANLLIKAIHDYPFSYKDRVHHIGASVGIAAITSQSADTGEILAQADMACYAAKQAGRNRSHIFEASQLDFQKLQEEMDWVGWVGQAIANKHLHLFRQRIDALTADEPQSNHAPLHYEVLLRIKRSPGSLEGPAAFLLAAERFNVAPTVDRWVMRTLCEWLATHPHDGSVYSVNLSGQSLNDEHFLDFVFEILDIHEIDGRRIAFEITETAAIHNLTSARRFIGELKSRGCTFYLDDFGKGLASFSYLKQLPVDYLKIDGSFVLDMLRDPTDFAIVNAFNQIAHDLSRKTVAECVENVYLLEKLREIGVDYVQGYAVHTPEPLPE